VLQLGLASPDAPLPVNMQLLTGSCILLLTGSKIPFMT